MYLVKRRCGFESGRSARLLPPTLDLARYVPTRALFRALRKLAGNSLPVTTPIDVKETFESGLGSSWCVLLMTATYLSPRAVVFADSRLSLRGESPTRDVRLLQFDRMLRS